MKKWTLLLLFFYSLGSVPSVLATSGRTNSSGCHNSKKVGYHCHGTPKTTTSRSTISTYKSTTKKYQNSKTVPVKSEASNSSLVKSIQIQLNSLGYNVGKADGIFGAKTESGIKKFQSKVGIDVDGKPTSILLMRLARTRSNS